MTRAFYRGYVDGTQRAKRVTRLHIFRDIPAAPRARWTDDRPRAEGWCGIHAWRCKQSTPVILDPLPSRPPEGLRWCPLCVGRLLDQAGLLPEAVALHVEARP